MNEPFKLRWKLPELLEREGISVYRLAQELNKKVSRGTLYRWTRGVPDRPDIEAIGWVLWAIKTMSGKVYSISDLVEVEFGPATLEGSGNK